MDNMDLSKRFEHFGGVNGQIIPHNSKEWWDARLGRIGSSDAKALGVTKQVTKGMKTLAKSKALQLYDPSMNSFSNYWTERGHAYEPLALELFEKNKGVHVQRNYYYTLGNHIGGSPDGVISYDLLNQTAGVEVKTLKGENVLTYIDDIKNYGTDWKKNQILKEHYAQVQSQIFVCGFSFVWFIVFCPYDYGYFIQYDKIYPDEKFMKLLWWKYEKFIELKKEYANIAKEEFNTFDNQADLQEWAARIFEINQNLH